jgi:acyl-CoA thioesterase-1
LTNEIASRAAKAFAAVVVFTGLAGLPAAQAAGPGCDAQLDHVRFVKPLPRVALKLARNEPIKIVAIGSSSTAGSGASSPAHTYPSRLQAELNQRFRGHKFNVVNRGIGGEEIGDMLKRFDKAVVAAKPDLVLWQLGTNAVIRDHRVTDRGASIRAGIDKIRATGADVVLINPQYAPKVIVKPDAVQMVDLIAMTAKKENVDLFPRFEVMRSWYEDDHLSFKTFVSSDGLHMNDWSYACLAKGLGLAIGEAATRSAVWASVNAE